jgi:plasmid stabilization system protein ParE
VERAVEQGLFTVADYTMIDAMAENIAMAQERLPHWAAEAGYRVEEGLTASSWQMNLPSGARQLRVHLEIADCFDFAAQPEQAKRYDLLIAHAFLDLVDIPQALPRLRAILRPHALCYLTINFDGGTILQPEIDPGFDQLIESVYHETMDRRMTNGQPSGDSHSGRHLFGHLRTAGIEIIDAIPPMKPTFSILSSRPCRARCGITLRWIKRASTLGSKNATPKLSVASWSILPIN